MPTTRAAGSTSERLERVRDAAGELIDDLADHRDRVEAAAEKEEDDEDKPLAQLSKAETSPELLAMPCRRIGGPGSPCFACRASANSTRRWP